MRKNEILGLDCLAELTTEEAREINGGAGFNFGQLFSSLGSLFGGGGSGGGFGSFFSRLFGGGSSTSGGSTQGTAPSTGGFNLGSIFGSLFR